MSHKIDIDTLGERQFDVNELYNAIRRLQKVRSWGAQAWKAKKNAWLRFKSNGYHHKGHVYIHLGWNDTFTVTLTSTKGTIIETITDVYLDVLIDVIDKKIEYIDSYEDR